MQRTLSIALAALSLTACAPGPEFEPGAEPGADLPLGRVPADDLKADGHWGDALRCKPIPDVPALEDPHLTISIDGLALKLVDRAGDYERVFPVGVGTIDEDETSPTYAESLSYYPIHSKGSRHFTIETTDNWNFNPCRVWWTSSDTGERLPVFAGLPFIRFFGPYGIHGPVTGYRQENGGDLVRGYVSHGCIRMEAADVVELYARISGNDRVSVTLQREPLRDDTGERVDPKPWIGTECEEDADCGLEGGRCEPNPLGGRGFCTVSCERLCPDREGDPGTLCVDDPNDPDAGICAPREQPENAGCRPYDHMVPASAQRHGEGGAPFDVCLPGSRGWIGDRCRSDGDCELGTTCEAPVGGVGDGDVGVCTMPCERFCLDAPGRPRTLCVNEDDFEAPTCLRQCDPDTGGAECPADFSCEPRFRHGDPDADGDGTPDSGTKWVCVPG